VGNSFFAFLNEVYSEFISGLPDLRIIFVILLFFTAWAFFCSKIAAYLKTGKGFKTGYTRKVYHFLIFISAAIINQILGFSGVCMFGIIVSCFIFWALIKRKTSGLYLALARESDHPNSTLYIIIPYLSTLLGGILINFYFPNIVILGYLICGIADASGEVIGTKYGKRFYEVKLFNFHTSYKSIEGSSSILTISFVIYSVYAIITFQYLSLLMIFHILLASVIVTVAEIITPKGFDNLTIQVISVLTYLTIIQ